MGDSTQIGFCTPGLRLTFSRDLAQKYTRYWDLTKEEEEKQTSRPPPTEPENTWQVTGYFDFLQVSEFKRLDDLKKVLPEVEKLVSWRSFRDLVLVPFADQPVPKDFTKRLTSPAKDASERNLLLAVIEMTLSPALFEFEPKSPTRTFEAIRHTIGVLEGWIKEQREAASRRRKKGKVHSPLFDFDACCFASLSGPDVVMLALPENARQVWGVHQVVCRARRLSLREIEEGGGHTPAPHATQRDWPGHACVTVEPILAFSVKAEERFRSAEYQAGEAKTGLRFNYHVWVDSGHESQVIQDTHDTLAERNLLPAKAKSVPCSFRTAWGKYAVEDHFDSLAQLVAVWRHRWFKADKEDHWREKHLIDSTTAVSFGDLKEAHEPPHGRRAWRLTEEVKKNLDKIRESLKVFGDTFLNASQLAELRSIYVSFRACFFRQGLLGTARDLLPFFWQLGEALSLVHQWREYLEPPKEDGTENRHESLRRWAEFSNGLQKLFGHLQRAVRNRIEHRSLQGDPPIPHTLTHGAGNIINSFSAVFWLAAELFRRHPEQTGDSVPGDIRCFAAAVCAGSCGRVECDELFDDFRRFIENEQPASGSAAPETSESRTRKPPTIPRPRRLLSLAGLPWSQRLLLLDISGVSLLRPELCFVHGLHEMAELSEWIMLPRNERLRTILNHWVVDEVAWAFAKALAQSTESPDSETCEPDVMAKARALHEFVLAWVMYSGVAHGLGHSTVATSAGVWEKRGELFSGPHPADLPGGLQDALEEAANDYRRALDADAPLCTTIETVLHNLMVQARGEGEAVHLPDERANVLDAARSDEFALTVEMIESLAKEVVADIGMWAAADHVLGEGRPRTSQDRLRDLNRIYKSLLRATAESYTSDGTRPRVDLFVLHRWAIQIAALSDGPEWIEIIHSELQNLQAELEAEWAEEQRESVLAECSQSAAPLHTLFPDEAMRYLETNPKRWPVQFGSQSSLTASLRTLACYRTSATDDAGIPRFAPEKSFSPMERELFSAFRAAWNHPDSQHHSTRPNDESIRFVQLLWATAGCFGVPSILEEVPPKEEQSPSTQPP